MAREYSVNALDCLVEIAKGGESEQARVSASNSILDRAFGKPPQAVTGEGRTTCSDPTSIPHFLHWIKRGNT